MPEPFTTYQAEIPAEPDDVTGFDAYMERHRRGLAIERAAVEALA